MTAFSMPRPLTGGARRRPVRPLSMFDPPTEERTATAMDDAAQAEQLIADLLALVDAGLVAPVADGGQWRYTPGLLDPGY